MNSSLYRSAEIYHQVINMAGGEALAKLQEAVVEMAIRQAGELARMKALGMRIVGKLERRLSGRLSARDEAMMAQGSRGIVFDFDTVARAIRQIDLLEQEVLGLVPARRRPDDWEAMPRLDTPVPRGRRLKRYARRDNTQDYYDTEPVGRVVDWVRKTLDIETPVDDPFMRDEADAEPVSEPDEGQAPAADERRRVDCGRTVEFADDAEAEPDLGEDDVGPGRIKPPRGPP